MLYFNYTIKTVFCQIFSRFWVHPRTCKPILDNINAICYNSINMKRQPNTISKTKQKVHRLSAKLYKHLQKILKAESIIKGSVYNRKCTCGNPNCKCAKGELHNTPTLSLSRDGKTRLVYLTKYTLTERAEIKRQVKSYQGFRYNRAQVVNCFKELIAEISKLETGLLVELPPKKGEDNGEERNNPGGEKSDR